MSPVEEDLKFQTSDFRVEALGDGLDAGFGSQGGERAHMGRFKRNRRGAACPVCGEDNQWCAQNGETGAVDCMKAGGGAAPGWRMVTSKVGRDGHVHSIYVPEGSEQGVWKRDPEAERRRAEEERKWRERAAANARALWAEASKEKMGEAGGADHPVMRAYFAGRGIDLARLPGGKLPATLRYHPRTPYKGPRPGGAEGEEYRGVVPAVLGLGQRYARAVRKSAGGDDVTEWMVQSRCVQRIYLDVGRDAAGNVTARKLGVDEAKKGLGPFGGDEDGEGGAGGAAVRLSGPGGNGVLVLCEGIETGLAILASVKDVEVWACISSGGLVALRLPPTRIDPSVEGGCAEEGVGISRVVIAADLDHVNKSEHRTGEMAARFAANGLRAAWPGLRVEVALPSRGLDAKLEAVIDERGEIVGVKTRENPDGVKSVDWLDVLRVAGAGVVAKGVLGESLGESAGGDGGGRDGGGEGGGAGEDGREGGERREIIPETRMGRAVKLLERVDRELGAEDAAGGVVPLRWYGASWWVWVSPREGSPRWRPVSPEKVEAMATRMLDGFDIWKRGGTGPFMPKHADVTGALLAALNFVDVPQEAMPCWLEPQRDERGGLRLERTMRFGDGEVEGPIEAENIVAFRNGLLDVEAWVDGRVRLLPPTSRWFSRSCVPFDLPVEKLVRAEEEGETDALLGEMCATWLKFLHHISAGDEQWQDQLCRWFGYCLTSDVSLERILWLQGDPGTGKGTVMRALEAIVGKENYASSTLDALAGKFDLAAFVGRSVVVVPELRVGPMTNMAGALDRVNSISGGDPQSVEDKFQRKQSNVRIAAKFVFTPNEEPKMSDPSNAILRRLLVLPMGDPPKKPDSTLKGKVLAESEGIMLWALYGLRALRLAVREGKPAFIEPKAGEEIRDEIRRAAAPVRAFLDDCCEREREAEEDTDELYKSWNEWREGHGHQEMAQQTFGRHLRVSGWKVKKVERKVGGARRYVYRGLRLRDDARASAEPPREFWPGG